MVSRPTQQMITRGIYITEAGTEHDMLELSPQACANGEVSTRFYDDTVIITPHVPIFREHEGDLR